MLEIKLKIGKREYTLNNNSEKYDRAKHDAGENAKNEQILAHYDKHAGYIRDEMGNEVKNGPFWEHENERLTKIRKRKENWSRIKSNLPVVVLVVGIVAGIFIPLVIFLYENQIWPFTQ